jgi:hypothetical protein
VSNLLVVDIIINCCDKVVCTKTGLSSKKKAVTFVPNVIRAAAINIILLILSLLCLAGCSQQLSSEPWLLARHSHLPPTTARPKLLPVDCLHCLTDNQRLTTVPLMALYW